MDFLFDTLEMFGLSGWPAYLIVGFAGLVLLVIIVFVIVVIVRSSRRKRRAARTGLYQPAHQNHPIGQGQAGFGAAGGAMTGAAVTGAPSFEQIAFGGEAAPSPAPSATNAGYVTAPSPQTPQQPWPTTANDTVPIAPLSGDTESEYARLAAEEFAAPPSAPLGSPVAPEPFSWTAATRPAEEPEVRAVQAPPVHPAAAPPAVPVASPTPPVPPAGPAAPSPPAVAAPSPAASPNVSPVPPVQPHAAPEPRLAEMAPMAQPAGAPPRDTDDDLDRTVVSPRRASFDWVLELPDGQTLPLTPDTVVGRKPEPVGTALPLVITDPTRTVSKTHARLRFDGSAWTVEDLASTNGVLLIDDDGHDHQLDPHEPTPITGRLLLGTLEVRVRPGGGAAR